MNNQRQYLFSKLYIPGLHQKVVQRQDLYKVLDRMAQNPLTVISSPAGSGKTTLICSYISYKKTFPAAWFSIDENDNDPIKFFWYLISALRTVDSSVEDNTLDLLHSTNDIAFDNIITLLLNSLNNSKPIILVMDDYHLINNKEIHRYMKFFIDNLPPNIHVCILSREKLPFSLAKLRSRGLLLELDNNNLRFSSNDVKSFLNDIMNLNLSDDKLAEAEISTEGWIAGLQMLALYINEKHDRDAVIQKFGNNNKYILEYMAEEVLALQPTEIQNFLLKTSILDILTPPLCDEVTETDGSLLTLQTLEKSNLFIVPLEGTSVWYRYHHLFIDFLRNQLIAKHPDKVPELYTRAALWYRNHGYLDNAISCFISGEKNEEAVKLVEASSLSILRDCEFNTLKSWLKLLGDETVSKNLRLCLDYIWLYFVNYDITKIDYYLGCASKIIDTMTPDEKEASDLICEFYTFKALVESSGGNLEESKKYVHIAYNHSSDNKFVESILALNDCFISIELLHKSDAISHLRRSIQLSIEDQNMYIAIFSTKLMGDFMVMLGNLHEMKKDYEKVINFVLQRAGKEISALAIVYAGMGEIHYHWGELNTAEDYLIKAIKLGVNDKIPEAAFVAYQNLSLVYCAQKRNNEAISTFCKAEEVAKKIVYFDRNNHLHMNKANLYLYLGSCQVAEKWISDIGISENTEINDFNSHDYITLSRLLIHKGILSEAKKILNKLYVFLDNKGFSFQLLEVSLLQAIVCFKLDIEPDATDFMITALNYAIKDNFVQLFVNEGDTVQKILQKVKLCIPDSYLNEFINQITYMSKNNGVKGTDMSKQKLIDPISEREMEVLRLLASGVANKDIAKTLYISVNTVKKHILNIYEKLDVHNKAQAAARAHELNLL